VLFNGIRVGEVTGLKLVLNEPKEIDVTISVDANTPVRADTQASLDFQGLSTHLKGKPRLRSARKSLRPMATSWPPAYLTGALR
jgi:hypothetical protein